MTRDPVTGIHPQACDSLIWSAVFLFDVAHSLTVLEKARESLASILSLGIEVLLGLKFSPDSYTCII